MLKTLGASIREYKKPSFLAPFFVTLEVALECIIPFLMTGLIDFGIDAGDMNYILKTGGILIILCGFSLLCGALSGKYAAEASAGFAVQGV